MVEDPPDLRRREVRIEPQARTPADLPSQPVAARARHRSAVLLSCQLMAGYTGAPVLRSHTITVSPWFARPRPAISAPARPAWRMHAWTACRVTVRTSRGSCSTHPGRGYDWLRGTVPSPSSTSDSLNARAFVRVVP